MTRHEPPATCRERAGQPSRFTVPPPLTLIAAAVVLAVGLCAGQAHALALGAIDIQSALGEPLRAEIDVSDISAAEIDNLRLQIPSAEAFRQAGIAYNPALAEVRASLQRRADGRYMVRLTGTRPLDDPFIDLLLEAGWGSGRIIRDYTLLLNPPSGRTAVAAATAADTPPPPAAVAPAPTRGPAPANAPVVSAAPPAPVPPAASLAPTTPAIASAQAAAPAGDRQITVQRGDTAGEIARVHKPAEISLDQMLLALLRANPDAFIGGNVNRMRSGAVLNLPTAAQASAVPSEEARQTVIAQSRDFGEYRRRLAENAPTSRVASTDRQATGRLQANVEDRSAAAPTSDRLTIAQAGSARGKEEELLKARAARESQDRVAELSRNIDDLRKLADSSQPGSAVASQPAPSAAAPAAASAPSVAAPTSTPALAGPDAARPANADAKGPPTPATGPTPTAKFIDMRQRDKVALAALGLVLLIVLLAYRIRQRRKSRHGEESIFQQSDARLASDLTAGTTGLPDGIDPIAEADACLARGLDLKAETILREALLRHPERTAIALKLLEIHARRHDVDACDTLARSVRETTGGIGPDWQHAQAMGRALDPGNPLYEPAEDRAEDGGERSHAAARAGTPLK